MEVKSSSSNKEEGEAAAGQEKESDAKKQINVTMGMEVLDCPVCSNPLSPPIFQCSLGHFLCSDCRGKLTAAGSSACGVCSRDVVDRCYGMERVVDSIVVPCSYAEHGCTDVITYHRKGEHEQACPHAPCFCPEKGCGFAGTTAALLDHFTARHKWPATEFRYYVPFDVPVKAGVHVLRGGGGGGDLFLLNVAFPGSPLHAISLVRVQPHAPVSSVECSVGFSWFKGHYQVSTLDMIWSSSLSDGLPDDYFCVVPEARRGDHARVVLRVTIDTDMVYDDDDDELEEEDDDDESYDPEDDDSEDDSSDDEEDDEGGKEVEDRIAA